MGQSGLPVGEVWRLWAPVQEVEAMPRLVWPQEASEALWGTGTLSNADPGHGFWCTRAPCDPMVSVVPSVVSVV